jgi:hypothetical protein
MEPNDFGCAIERRRILWMAPLAFLSPTLGLGASAAEDARNESLSWDEFLTRASREAKTIFDPAGYDEDVYLLRLASEAVRLSSIPEEARTFPFGNLTPAVEFGPVYRGVPFAIIQWRLAPHAYLPPHNHPHYNVLTLGLGGEAEVTHYELDGEAPAFESSAAFRLRRTRTSLIAPRRVSPLTTVRDNIHTFRAGSGGARGIDITTLNGADIGFSFIEIGTALDLGRDVFEAHWRKL